MQERPSVRSMEQKQRKTVIIVAGLPYSGKTAIIQGLQKILPGKTVYVDGIFRDLVTEEEVCLERWLLEGPQLVKGMMEEIEKAEKPYVYVEIGILQKKNRKLLTRWVKDKGYHLVPVLLQCQSREEVQKRQSHRAAVLSTQKDKLKIAIDLEELYGPILAAFQIPEPGEGFHSIDTSKEIEENLEEIKNLIILTPGVE